MEYAAIIVLLILSAFFSSAETAFSSASRIRIKQLAETNKRAKTALDIIEHFDSALTSILIGNNIVNILSAALGTVICTSIFGVSGVGIATAAMTVLVLIFGEILPKSLAKENAEQFCIRAAIPLKILMTILTPVTLIFSGLKKLLTKEKTEEPTMTEDELKYFINEIENEGVLEERESDLVRSALDLDEKKIAEICIPRVQIVGVERDMTIDEVKDIFFSEKYSRLPVYEKTADSIIGYIHEKDFFNLIENSEETSIKSIIHDVIYTTEFTPCADILSQMQRSKIHLAVVMDQYGGTYGMVTMEDLIEEILGEIYDEADENDDRFKAVDKNIYEVRSELPLHDFLELSGNEKVVIDTENITVGGWAMELFGYVPKSGETVTSDIFEITVLEALENRIIKLRIKAG